MASTFFQWLLPARRQANATSPSTQPRARARELDSQHWLPLERATTEVKELNSVEEEVDIFLLMGRPDMAAELLRHHIAERGGAPAHLWLRLLDVLRTLGLRMEFEQRALEMKARFNVELPLWQPQVAAMGLEGVPHVLEKIVRHWNSPGCLGYVSGLMRDIRDGGRAGFRFEAFTDLALLMGVLVERNPLRTAGRK